MTTKRYRVTSAYVMAKVETGQLVPSTRSNGMTMLGYYRNALLPANVAPGEVDRLLAGGHIEAVESDG